MNLCDNDQHQKFPNKALKTLQANQISSSAPAFAQNMFRNSNSPACVLSIVIMECLFGEAEVPAS